MPVAARRREVRVEKCMFVVELGGRWRFERSCFVWRDGRGCLRMDKVW
jgi:hypothetical protein